jgi:ABC-2 type transport system ATP-binding protein
MRLDGRLPHDEPFGDLGVRQTGCDEMEDVSFALGQQLQSLDGLYPKMAVAEQLVYLTRLSGVDTATAVEQVDKVLAELDIDDQRDALVETLSLGNQQRVQLAAALASDPELLVLDEPFSGLDPIGVDVLAEALSRRAHGGAGVLFSSHQLELVGRVCDRVVIIDHGRIVEMTSAIDAGSLGERFREVVSR